MGCEPCRPAAHTPSARTPVTIITGGFGVGKTELIKHVLTKSGLRVACLFNDVADISVELRSLQDPRSGVPLVAGAAVVGGCICCTRRESFVKQITMLSNTPGVDHILVETSGVAEPLHVAENFALMPDAVCLDTLVAVIDAVSTAHMYTALRVLAEKEEPGRQRLLSALTSPLRQRILKPPTLLLYEQIRFANVVFINQCDLVSHQCLADLVRVLHLLNPTAEIVQCAVDGILNVAPHTIINTKKFSMEEVEHDERWFEESRSGIVKRCIPLAEQALTPPDRIASPCNSNYVASRQDRQPEHLF